MAVNINVPSQVKTYANLAAFPATGALKTIYIAEDTNKTYRWTGSVYVEVSASASGITIGSTAIASGVVGRVLFEGAGNVVQESSSLFWDNTNSRFGIGTSSPAYTIDSIGTIKMSALFGKGIGTSDRYFTFDLEKPTGTIPSIVFGAYDDNATRYLSFGGEAGSTKYATQYLYFFTGATNTTVAGTRAMAILPSGNINIGSSITDAGFRLDVNGTARVQGNTSVSLNQNAGTNLTISNTNSGSSAEAFLRVTASNGSFSFSKVSSAYPTYKQIVANDSSIYNGTIGDISIFNDFATGRIKFGAGGSSTANMSIFSTGNVGINTTTDAGFRLDVNGTARVGSSAASGQLYIKGGAGTGQYLYLDNGGTDLWTIIGGSVFVIDSSATRIFRANSNAQVTINGSSVDASSQLQVDSTTRGFLPPRMTTTQKNAIATPAAGLVVYDTTLNKLCVYTTAWETVTSL